ncbi:hypothetical protein [Rubrivirga marina]|uniref:Uncharacterized protein n=1 Tax=Rubrivirga marina TaxID=1196024 RepID=A0A271J261_9BACT|nr:hypothetical protein [Rubrivirga marina]PAP77045.1 hypothetical protein BSZ37_11690 [Rubrivirga marina]
MRIFFLSLGLLLAACTDPSSPRLETAADSLAFRVTESSGGLAAWNELPGIAFEWAVVRDSSEVVRTRHVWDKQGDRVRSEWPGGGDSVFVAVFQPSRFDEDAPEGEVALNGVALVGPEVAERLVEANGRFVNDGYWLLAPLKVLDPGVRRAVEARDGADRLALSFDGVGLTPGDRYWIEVDEVSGAMTGWSFLLESGNEGRFQWVEPVTLDTPGGQITLSRMKVSDDGGVILTEPTPLLDIDETEFTDLTPRLGQSAL